MRARKQTSFPFARPLGQVFHGRAVAKPHVRNALAKSHVTNASRADMKKDARDTHDLVFDAPSKSTRQSLRGR
jgi:hypothetical protein